MIGQAISWIFEKILEIAEKIIEWIGFIFNWSDIKATHNSIVSLVNNALDAMAAKADLAPDAIEAYFDGFTDVIRSTCDGGSLIRSRMRQQIRALPEIMRSLSVQPHRRRLNGRIIRYFFYPHTMHDTDECSQN